LLEWNRRTNCWLPLARPPPGRNGAGAPPRLHHGPRGQGGPEPGGARRPAASHDRPDAPLAPPLAPPPTDGEGAARQDSPNAATLLLRHHPRPPCGRRWYRSAVKIRVRGGTPRNHPLSYSGRRRAAPTNRWPLASDGPSAERRIVGPCRHWRPRGRSVGAYRAGVAVGGSQSAPYNLGAGRQCSPARLCSVSWAGTVSRIASGARLRRLRGHRAGRSQSAVRCTLGGCSRSAIAQCPRARRPVELGRACGQVARPRAACSDARLTPRPVPDDPAIGAVTWPVAMAPRIGRNAGRWLQSQSESGGPDHGPEGDHGRRAEPNQ
jgi:hypothetical protein